MHKLQPRRNFMVAWQLTSIVNLKKDDHCTNNAPLRKGGINYGFGPSACQKNNVF